MKILFFAPFIRSLHHFFPVVPNFRVRWGLGPGFISYVSPPRGSHPLSLRVGSPFPPLTPPHRSSLPFSMLSPSTGCFITRVSLRGLAPLYLGIGPNRFFPVSHHRIHPRWGLGRSFPIQPVAPVCERKGHLCFRQAHGRNTFLTNFSWSRMFICDPPLIIRFFCCGNWRNVDLGLVDSKWIQRSPVVV